MRRTVYLPIHEWAMFLCPTSVGEYIYRSSHGSYGVCLRIYMELDCCQQTCRFRHNCWCEKHLNGFTIVSNPKICINWCLRKTFLFNCFLFWCCCQTRDPQNYCTHKTNQSIQFWQFQICSLVLIYDVYANVFSVQMTSGLQFNPGALWVNNLVNLVGGFFFLAPLCLGGEDFQFD